MKPLDLIAIRRDLHRHPEVAFEEYRTAGVIEAALRQLGLASRRCARPAGAAIDPAAGENPLAAPGTGLIAEIVGALPGPTVALRADIDALPVTEATGLPFASTVPGKMHACGHDVHTAILLGAAQQLVERRASLHGRVRLLFQPAEEFMQGAEAMVKDHALDGLSAIFGLHNQPLMPVGTASFGTGPMMAASDRFRITIAGQGGHAALAHLTHDPLVAAAAVILSLQTAVSRVINPLEPVVVSICRCVGGNTFNVIPDRVELEGTVRCLSPQVRAELPALLQSIAGHTAKSHRCEAQLEWIPMVPPVVGDARVTALARETASRLLGADKVSTAAATMASEDFAVYQEQVPGCYFWLGSGGPHSFHHPGFQVDEACIAIGADLLAAIAESATASL